ncbi:acyl-CoA thioesterase [Truepera radiovictrix]|uniref:Thioesterase superfamily protein n=1 Tax=Truepera radiovictrix (strain DSM 17093 / CIP 108686 / LMG 22925 / RQ-24) TaxID=649638 RepID=D7CY14_TRURR|nr:thioesterase family protein [Truepera radiovictrix]ADI13374.1 thioesterase superfamily protein [Truepera radiovictrix DSM 17093]WMT58063.1 thioesterase family protein [Truepera radiovictrix]
MEPFRTDIQVRFSDTDALGHLNNIAYALYAEQARVDLFNRVLPREGRGSVFVILAHIALDFLRQIRFGEAVYVMTRVSKLGRTSVTLDQEVYADDELAAKVRSVVVLFDFKAQQPTPLPEALRAQLEPAKEPA